MFLRAFKKARSGKSKCTIHCKSTDDVPIPIQLSMNKVELESDSGVCLIATDLKEQRRYEETRAEVQRLSLEQELRERFVSTLSHDLRNPLAAAKTSAEIIVRYPCQMEKHSALGSRIVRNVERADKMIQDLLDTNRIRAGERLPLLVSKCDLLETTNATLQELSMAAGDRFVLNAEESVVGYWSCEQLRRVIANLVTNALRYGTPHTPLRSR